MLGIKCYRPTNIHTDSQALKVLFWRGTSSYNLDSSATCWCYKASEQLGTQTRRACCWVL